jgi:thioredoxin-related protein
MKRLFGVLFATALLLNARAETGWVISFDQATQQAKKENKAVLMDFTGSDWCGFCIKLKKNVFDTPEFSKFAEKNLVLMEVDFPQKKKQSAELKAANAKLNKKYEIEGYPTIFVVNSEGKTLGSLVGYDGETPSEYIAKLEKIIAKDKAAK